MRWAVLAGSLVAFGSVCLASAQMPSDGVLLGHRGDWTLTRMGGSDMDLRTDTDNSGQSITYRLPDGAKQGPKRWYLMHIHVAVDVSPDTRSGFVAIGGATNGWASEAINLKVKAGEPPTIRWSSLDLVKGPQSGTVRGTHFEFDGQNYMQNRGVRRGHSKLQFGFQRFGDNIVKLSRVTVFADSGIRISALSPPHLTLDATLPKRQIGVREWFKVGYTLTSDGDRPAIKGAVSLESDSPALQIKRPSIRRFHILQHGRRLTGHFRARALHAEKFHIDVLAGAGNSNSPAVEIAAPFK